MSAMTLDRLVELIEARFQQMDTRFQQMDARFEQMDARFQQMEARLGRVENATDSIATDLAGFRIDVLERFHRLDTRIDRLGDEMRQRFGGLA